MSLPNELLPVGLLGTGAATGGYQIERSLRFNSSDSAFLSRTPTSAGNRKTWTWAGWVKRSGLGALQQILGCTPASGLNDSNCFGVGFGSDDTLGLGGGLTTFRQSTSVFRDPSAWYHFVFAIDTTQASAANRIRAYVNGSELTWASSSSPAQNADLGINQNIQHSIGSLLPFQGRYFDGLLADVFFIDGQALDPSSFVETSATTGQLLPRQYTGSFGTNGFWLQFADNSSNTATTLGKDYSGNSNNWTPNNLSVTAGAGNDSLVDTPTSYGTDTGAGGEVRGNYCTWNPLPTTTAKTFSDGNLQVVGSGTDGYSRLYGTFGMATGKWYFEVVPIAISGYVFIGISASEGNGYSSNAYYYYSATGAKTNRGAGSGFQAYGNSYTANDVIGVAVDMDTGKIWFAKNGTWQASGNPAAGTNAAYTDVLTYLKGAYVPYVTTDEYYSYTVVLNAGQRPFAYTAPSGFKALCDTNLPAPVVAKSSDYFQTVLYTGNGGSKAVSGLSFSPDLVWIKGRSVGYGHRVFDTVRGTGTLLYTNATDSAVAQPNANDNFASFDSGGFSLGAGIGLNENNATYVAWAFDAGTTTTTNTQGSITGGSQVRANPSSGFSVVTWTGQSTAATIGHGLNAAPSLIICKARSNAQSWGVYHKDVGINSYLLLDSTGAATSYSGIWGSSAPTSTVFGVPGNVGLNNISGWTYVAYCFSPVAGYSSFGSYVGNGSTTDNTFVYTGMRPRFVMLKRSDSTGNWVIWDAVRNSYNVANSILLPNSSAAEFSPDAKIDILSNGFKVRDNSSDSGTNGATYIYAAFAESPLAYSRAR